MNTSKILFKLYTPYGNCFLVNGKGEISKEGNEFSGQWTMKGLQSVKSNYCIPFNKLTKEFIASLQLRYKNGNPMFTVKDLDHGTTRIWGNTKHHGIKSISFL